MKFQTHHLNEEVRNANKIALFIPHHARSVTNAFLGTVILPSRRFSYYNRTSAA